MKKYLPAIILVAAFIVVISQGWHEYFTLDQIVRHREKLQDYVTAHYALALLIYFTLYALSVSLSLPGGTVLTIVGGFLFGWLVGGVTTVFAATLGALVIFFVARSAFGSFLSARAGPFIEKLRGGFCRDAFHYMLFLRLVPVFPFWLVNLAPALIGVRPGVYALGTFIGIIPGTFAFCFVGAGLNSIIAAQQGLYQTCLQEKAAGTLAAGETCTLSLKGSALITPELVIAFCALGLIALVPVLVRKWQNRKRRDTGSSNSQGSS